MSTFISPLSYPYLIAAASNTNSKPAILPPYDDTKVIPALAANETNGRATVPRNSTNGEEVAAGRQLYRRWQEIRQLNSSMGGLARELASFLLHEVVPAGAAAIGSIENKE